MYDQKKTLKTDIYKSKLGTENRTRTIFWGEVISVEDPTDGGRIKVRIPDFDNKKTNENIPYAYPLLPKFFHLYPQEGELVRIIIEDVQFPERSRFWLGSIISQPHKIGYDSIYSALSTTNLATSSPDRAPSTFPKAKGVFPEKEDVAIIGKSNNDVILRKNEVELRAGKHEFNDILSLNKKNPASVRLVFEESGNTYVSSVITMGNRIALISHDGSPKFKASQLSFEDSEKIFKEGHPIGRADIIVNIMEIFRRTLIEHIHPYASVPPDKSGVLLDLEKLDFNEILQKNIVIN
jgi:hypothetical protein